ncbi:MAG: VWA domain-containing protein [Chloroflexi bacterium]|nr:VWA domain-containing protein [Chloroflexota bacterium]
MTTGLADLERELERFPSSVVDEFRRAAEKLGPRLSEFDVNSWAKQGVDIAKQTVRSWEAAAEYFRSSPEVLELLNATQLLEWGRHGSALCQESPSLAVSFFRASPRAFQSLRPRNMQIWANLGKGFYRGTWKSSALSAKFFEISGPVLETASFAELESFAGLMDLVAHKSADLAAECMAMGETVLPRVGNDRPAFIRLCRAVAEANWREVKGCFEAVPKVTAFVQEGQRARFMDMTADMAKSGMPNISLFIHDSATSLGRASAAAQGRFLELAQELIPRSNEAAAAFLRNAPSLIGRVSESQVEAWYDYGLRILMDNLDGGMAYFRIESNTSEQVIEALSSAVELDRIADILRMYCRGLAGAEVDIANSKDMAGKNIGWVSEDHATTEGTTVYLPPEMNKFGSKDENFSFFKVVSTHQVAHIEFGSFDFDFDAKGNRFQDTRHTREQEALQEKQARLEARRQQQGQSQAPGQLLNRPDVQEGEILLTPGLAALEAAQEGQVPQTDGAASAERGYLTDMGRFFDMFPIRKLALDLFTVLEDTRLDYRVKAEYPGVAPAYRRIQADALSQRPDIKEMALQEAMVEFLVRFSLNQHKNLPVPTEFIDQAAVIAEVAKRLLHTDAVVEDTAEAALRVYDIIAKMPNQEMEEEDWSEMDVSEQEIPEEQLENLLEQMREMAGAGQGQMGEEEEGEEYESPPQVDFRGDFKPELSQILNTLRQQAGQGGQQSGQQQMPLEMLEQMLANSAELELDAESGEFNADLAAFVQNLVKEAGSQPGTQQPGQGYGPIPHQEEEGSSLESKDPKTFVYDEWDFRAGDYKPRWCIVREKPMAEGDTRFYTETVHAYGRLMNQIRRQFEMLMPEEYRKVKHLPDGDDFDLDAVIESIIDKWAGLSPTEKVHWRRNKIERDVAVAFLLDMSASTAEAIDESRRVEDWDAPDDPVEYMIWLRSRRGEGARRTYKRIIDLEKESIVLLIHALETVGDTYGIYGFSGYGRENVEFYVIKDMEETFNERIKRRVDKVTPLHATRMGPAIRHTIAKLEEQEKRTKLLILLSDGRPQDRGYSREGVEKEYAVHDTKMAFVEARRKGITPFALTVDKAGHDYLKTMCQDMGYEVLGDINSLPSRLPMLYRKLTF